MAGRIVSSSSFPLALRAVLVVGLPATALALGTGCAAKIDRFAVDRVFARAVVVPDLGRGCAVGLTLGYPMEAATSPENPPRRGVIMSDASAALCAEDEVRDAQLESARLEKNLSSLEPARQIALIKDARERERRAHELAALRYSRAWDVAEDLWGPIGSGDECPKIDERDEIVWLMALNSGINGLMHDRAAGGGLDLPLDRLLKVARASECLDNERWWHVPEAMRGAAWATVPGSAPEGVDPWALLETAASTGDDGGVRLARALQVVIAANNGRPDVVESGIQAFAESRAAVPTSSEFALFDDYARLLVRHESDLLWTKAEGYRTLELGALPGGATDTPVDGPTGDDPFGADPFGGGGETGPVEGSGDSVEER
jgi:hypothetical protein